MTLLYGFSVQAQVHEAVCERSGNYFDAWEIAAQGGRTINQTDKLKQTFSYQFQVAISHQLTPEDYGPAKPNFFYPSLGVSMSYVDMNRCELYARGKNQEEIHDQYGRFLSLAFTINQYHYVHGHFRVRSLIENGLAYAFSPYDPLHGHALTSIGGRIQVYFNLGLFACYAKEGHELALGPQFTHISNSGVCRPNSGVNNLFLGLRYRRSSSPSVPHSGAEGYRLQTFRKHSYWCVNVNGGLHAEETQAMMQNKDNTYTMYGQMGLSLDWMYRFCPHHALGLGFDYFYNNFGRLYPHHSYLGMAFKHETYFKNLAININVGAYLNDRHPKGGKGVTRIYERIGMKYYWGQQKVRPYVGYFIKGNGFTAEQFECCMGVAFRQ